MDGDGCVEANRHRYRRGRRNHPGPLAGQGLFDVSNVVEGRFVYDYDHDALDYGEALAGHYVLTTSLTPETADAPPGAGCLPVAADGRGPIPGAQVARLGLRPIRHWTESRVRGYIAMCVLAAVIELLIGNRLADADLRDPDLEDQHLSADRAFQELDPIRQVTFTVGETTIEAVTRRNELQTQILAGPRGRHPRLGACPRKGESARCGVVGTAAWSARGERLQHFR